MGARGRAPTPTEILKRRGSWRGNSRPSEPKPQKTAPPKPRRLTKEQSAVWKQLVPELERLGVLSRIDGNALERYCTLWIRWRRASDFLEKYGESYPLKDNDGKVKCFMPFPQAAVVNKLSVLLLRLEQEFGLTPASRTRIQVTVEPEADAEGKGRFFKVCG